MQGAAQETKTRATIPRERVFMWSTFDPKRHIRWYFRPVGPALRFWEIFKVFQAARDVQCSGDTVSGNDTDMTALAQELRDSGFVFVDNPKEST